MTMGEMALFFNDVLGIHANLKVVPCAAGVASSGSIAPSCRG